MKAAPLLRTLSYPALVGLWLAAPRQALAGGWRWPESELRRYHLQSYVVLPEPFVLQGERNVEVASTAYQLDLSTACQRIGAREPWEIRCSLDDLRLAIRSDLADRTRAATIAREWAGRLRGASVLLHLDPEGILLDLQLEGVSHDDQRRSLIHQHMTEFLERAFAGLDLALPSASASAEPWTQTQSLLNAYPSDIADLSATEIQHVARQDQEGLVHVSSTGTGRLAPGKSTLRFSIALTSEATVDLGAGALRSRTWTVVGTPTSGSTAAPAARGQPYAQAGFLEILAEPSPTFADSGDWEAAAEEGPAIAAMRRVYQEPTQGRARSGPRGEALPRFAWSEIGSSLITEAEGMGPGFHLGGGLRLPPGFWFGARAGLPGLGMSGGLPDSSLVHPRFTVDLGLGSWWSPAWRLAPRVGVVGGTELRHYEAASPSWLNVPYLGFEAGLQVRLVRSWYLGLNAQVRDRLRELRVREGALGAAETLNPLAGAFGLDLVVGLP